MPLSPALLWLAVAAARVPGVPAPGVDAVDPVVVDAGSVLDRTAWRDAVLAANLELKSAKEAVRSASARARAARAWDDPMLALEVTPLALFSDGGSPMTTVRLSQAVPTGGRLRASVDAADAERAVMEADEATVRQDLALTAVQVWDGWYLVHRALDINAEHDALLAELEVSARAAWTAGRASAQAPLSAAAERAVLADERAMLLAERASMQADMNALLHRPASDPVPPPPAGVALASPPPSLAVEVDRPEVRALDASVSMAEADLAMARAERLPMLGIMASYGTAWMNVEDRLMVGVEATLPVWWGARGAAVEAARAERNRAELDREREKDAVQAEVAAARARVDEAASRAAIQRERTLPIARERLSAARAGFAAGTDDFEAVLASERMLRDARLGLDRAVVRWLDALAALDHATGALPGTPETMEITR